MKTDLELALDHARTYVHHRGVGVEPLTWEEVQELMNIDFYTENDLNQAWNEGYEEGHRQGYAEAEELAAVS